MPSRSFLGSRLLWKINLIFAAIVLVSAFLVAAFSAHRIRRSTLAEVEKNLSVQTTLLAQIAGPEIVSGNLAGLQQSIRRLGRETATRMTIILADGRVAADSEKDPKRMDNHADRPEIRQAALYAHGVSIRFSHTLKTRMMYFARALRREHRLIGYARTSLPLDLIDQRIAASRKTILLGIAVVAFLVLVSAFFMSRWFIRPLVSMTTMAEAMAAGDFSRRVNLKRRDEIGRLAESFNQMAENSRRRIETIAFDREKLDTILSGMSEGVVAVDRKERIIHLNRAAAELLDLDTETCCGRPLWETVRRPELREAIEAAGRSEEGIRKNLTFAHGSRERTIELHAAPLRAADGSNLGCVIVMLDISELRRLETVRRDFVVNASHELKTPITAIRALAETLLDNYSGMAEEERLSFLEKINTQVIRLSAITTDLMALSRFEQADGDEFREIVDLGEIVEEAGRTLKAAAENKKIHLATQVDDEEIMGIAGDSEALLQAITNLLDNAVKYTPAGGRIELELGYQRKEAVITVRDTGIGIKPEDCERIFERFYRVDKARSRELGGTGLGLSIVRHIVINHNGRIEVESRPGAGSSFRIYLHLPPDDNAPP
ncbi:MAG: cell wall metabolism sensor histidine kinase WalK [Deltaproteobacteria bacterium]|nr:cell wall metabolism sensor histidine kinase WalK [Deltaproteobacteria bacterium]